MADLLRNVSPFQDTLANIAQWATDRDIVLTRSEFTGLEKVPVARWPDGTWQDFLRAAGQAGAKIVWVEVRRYKAFEKEEDEAGEGAFSIRPYLQGGRLSETSTTKKEGRPLAALHISWSCEGILNVFLAGVRWERNYDSKKYAESNLEHDLHKVIEQAQLLVDLPQYASKENRKEREHLAQRLFGSDMPVKSIVTQAEALSEAAGRDPGEA